MHWFQEEKCTYLKQTNKQKNKKDITNSSYFFFKPTPSENFHQFLIGLLLKIMFHLKICHNRRNPKSVMQTSKF